ncbi:hypothetical protein TTRE_0000063901 [Trichuris trichiura]|uniref:Uncharacterized protein n=1 Tax=Trichuris trichiura TaxID=36087 RepID=A0A077Z1A8_TRITR|nr:hypothetical protein TTRE_0000063901 [Trichuris trichiura]
MLISLFRFYNVDSLPVSIANWEIPDKQVHWPTFVNWYPTEAAAPQFRLQEASRISYKSRALKTNSRQKINLTPNRRSGHYKTVGNVETLPIRSIPILHRKRDPARKSSRYVRGLRIAFSRQKFQVGWQPLKRDVLKQLTFLDQLNNEKNRG